MARKSSYRRIMRCRDFIVFMYVGMPPVRLCGSEGWMVHDTLPWPLGSVAIGPFRTRDDARRYVGQKPARGV